MILFENLSPDMDPTTMPPLTTFNDQARQVVWNSVKKTFAKEIEDEIIRQASEAGNRATGTIPKLVDLRFPPPITRHEEATAAAAAAAAARTPIVMTRPPSPGAWRWVIGIGVLVLLLSGLLAYDIAVCLTAPVWSLSELSLIRLGFPCQRAFGI
jgi:hypothetical protein